MDARQQRRADGERASSNGGRHGLDADLRREIPAAVRSYGKIGRVLQGHLVGPALNHRKRRLGNDLWRRNSQLGGCHRSEERRVGKSVDVAAGRMIRRTMSWHKE